MSLQVRLRGLPQRESDLYVVRSFLRRTDCNAVRCHCGRSRRKVSESLSAYGHRVFIGKMDPLISGQHSNTVGCLKSKQMPQRFCRRGSAGRQACEGAACRFANLRTGGDLLSTFKSCIFISQVKHNGQVGMSIERYVQDSFGELPLAPQYHRLPLVSVVLRHLHSESALIASCFQSHPHSYQRRSASHPIGNRAEIPRLPQPSIDGSAKRHRHSCDRNPKLRPFSSHYRAPGSRDSFGFRSSTPGSKDSPR